MKPFVISCGDPRGIGPEVTLKVVASEKRNPGHPGFVLVGEWAELDRQRLRLGLEIPWSEYRPTVRARSAEPGNGEPSTGSITILDPYSEPGPGGLGTRTPRYPSDRGALTALSCLRRATEGCLAGEFSALITAPVSKEMMRRAGVAFVGQTEYIAQLAGREDVTMMLLGDDASGHWLRVALVTTHMPLSAVPDAITAAGVRRAVRHAVGACTALGLLRGRIAVCGLNPHAGEGGHLGREEETIIAPAIEESRAEGFDVVGPLPADTVFYQALRGDFDAVVAMYHDQGLAPLKLIAFDSGVNWSLGLPFVRTSPDHGTAFDIAGRGIADASSMRAAVNLAARLAQPDRSRA